MIAPLELY